MRERLREVTTEAIIHAAEEVFAESGLHAAHMGDIASRAGVAVGTLYNHFKDREALLTGVIDARRAELFQRLDEVLQKEAARPFPEQLAAFLRAFLGTFEEHRRFMNILMQGESGRYHTLFPAAGKLPSEAMKAVYERVEKLIRRGVQKKALKPRGAEFFPSLLMGMMRGLLMHTLYSADDPSRAAPTQHVDRLVEFFLEGAGTGSK